MCSFPPCFLTCKFDSNWTWKVFNGNYNYSYYYHGTDVKGREGNRVYGVKEDCRLHSRLHGTWNSWSNQKHWQINTTLRFRRVSLQSSNASFSQKKIVPNCIQNDSWSLIIRVSLTKRMTEFMVSDCYQLHTHVRIGMQSNLICHLSALVHNPSYQLKDK